MSAGVANWVPAATASATQAWISGAHFGQALANALEAYSSDLGRLQSGLGVGLIGSTPQANVYNVERISWS